MAGNAVGHAVRVEVPGGIWLDGAAQAPVREFVLRPVDGDDEVFLLGLADSALPSERASALLARCLLDGAEVVRSLSAGDREALLLHLRRLTLGDRLECLLHCPAGECGEAMEFTLRATDLLMPPYHEARPSYDVAVEFDGARHEVTFRLPTSADLDHAATLARHDAEAGARELLRRCVARVARGGVPLALEALPASARAAIATAMAAHDPQAEIELDLACPSCGAAFSVIFDAATFFLQELDRRGERLLQEVHFLAWHYHWSEREILAMPARRRARYIELLADATARARE
ncbi:MAG TPA: hypothetical protein VFI42_08000 [Thermomicrobiaceae bacterium]|nr:hypothetical protein [Thermomicrobiaceae bacterium]